MDKYEFHEQFSTNNWDFPIQEDYWDSSSQPFEMVDKPTFCKENFEFLIDRHQKLVEYLKKRLFD